MQVYKAPKVCRVQKWKTFVLYADPVKIMGLEVDLVPRAGGINLEPNNFDVLSTARHTKWYFPTLRLDFKGWTCLANARMRKRLRMFLEHVRPAAFKSPVVMDQLPTTSVQSSAGLEIAVWGLVTFPFKSCVSQLSVDQISRNFVYF